MASLSDHFRTLPSELRQHVYSYLFFDDGDTTVLIRQKHNVSIESSNSEWLPNMLKLAEDPVYVARRRQKPSAVWPDEIEEAFFQALRWTREEHPLIRRKVNGRSPNEIISGLIYELTGQEKCRKAVSSHIVVLTRFLCERERRTRIMKYLGSKQATGVVNSTPGPSIFINNTAWKLEEFRLPHCPTTFAQIVLSLSLVNHFYRTDCLFHLASYTRFDFGSDRQALQHFYSSAPTDLLASMRHVHITLVEGYMPVLPEWPDLRTLAIDLWPRNPVRPHPKEDRAWGTQTEALLGHLGSVVAAMARITLEMRWAADCERFEREYVGKGRWRQVGTDDENGASDLKGGFRRRRYEMERTAVKVAETEKELASALGGLVV